MNIKKIRELDINKQLTKQQLKEQQEQQKKEIKSKLYKFVFWYSHIKRQKIVGGRMTVKDKKKVLKSGK